MKKRTTGVICTLLSLALTGYLLADTFLLRSAYQTEAATDIEASFAAAESNLENGETDASESSPEVSGSHGKKHMHTGKSQLSDQASAEAETETASVSDTADYSSDDISVTLEEYTVDDTQVYVADVTVSSAVYLKTAFADNTYGRNVTDTTSAIAESVGAILAVNGDFYGAQQSGFVIRGGVL